MAKFSVFFDGFSEASVQNSAEVATILAQALYISQDQASQLLSESSGLLLETEDRAEAEKLSSLAESLGLITTVSESANSANATNNMSFDSGASIQSINENTPTLSDTDGTSLSSNAIRVDELVENLETAQLASEENINLADLESKFAKKTAAQNESAENMSQKYQEDPESATEDEDEEDPLAPNDSSDVDWGQTDALAFVKKSRRTERLIDTATASIIAFLTVLLFYFFDNQNEIEENMREQQRYIETLMKYREAEERELELENKKKEEDTAIPTTLTLTGKNSADAWSLSSEIFVEEGIVKIIDTSIETPQPPNLTDEEIVNKIPRKPWLARVLVSNLSIKQQEDKKFIATGKARAFIEHRNRKLQSLAEVVMTGKLAEDNSFIDARIMINKGYDQIPLGDQVLIELNENNEYNLFIAVPVTAQFKGKEKK